jgi:glycerol uptake facilitator protein
MSPFLAEFLGTALLILLGNGVVANVVLKQTKGHHSGWIVITVGWGMAVFAAVFVASAGSAAHINPAVTLAMAMVGSFEWTQVPTYMLAQFLGAATGAGLVWFTYRDHYGVTEDQGAKRATFCTAPAIRNTFSNLFSEVLGTFVLILAVFYIAGATVGGEEASLGSLDALPVALVVLVIGLALGGTTGYAINPARDLGPRIMHAILPVANKGDNDWGYSWIPVVGPLLGAGLAAGAFVLLS